MALVFRTSLTNSAQGVARSSLLERLSHVGYFETHQALYEGFRLVSQEVALRLVNDSHLASPDSLSGVNLNHIDRVDYELNLNDERLRSSDRIAAL